jgi:tRNA nucleotidyltransferase/poly(A) polymerase
MTVALLDRVPALVRAVADAVPGGVYIVGGAVRDLLLGRTVRDWDLAADRPEEVARAVADRTHSRVVVMRDEPLALRVPVRRLGTVDVTLLDPAGPTEDLLRRDFTINALALDPQSGEMLDPAGGAEDLRRAIVRIVRETALADDPARIVRAYRLAGDLGFRIDGATRDLLRRDRRLLADAAPQRLGAELLRLFEGRRPVGPVMAWMDADRVLDEVLPAWADLRGVAQGHYHHRDVLGHTLEAVDFADLLLSSAAAFFPRAGRGLREALAHPHRRASVRAAVLLHDLGKPPMRFVDDAGRIWFRGHEARGADMAAALTRAWGWPRTMHKAISQMVGGHMRVMHLCRDTAARGAVATDSALRRLLRDEPDAVPGVFLVGVADLLASRGPATRNDLRRGMLAQLGEMAARCLELREEERRRPRLVTGADLMVAFGLSPGPPVGRLLAAIAAAREAGEATTRDEALALARDILNEGARAAPEDD